MNKILMVILSAILIMSVSSSVFAKESKSTEKSGFQVSTPNNTQRLGGKSGMRSHKGLGNAAEHSSRIQADNKDSDSGISEKTDDISDTDKTSK